jgi:predicted PurR-regulated permease PerM
VSDTSSTPFRSGAFIGALVATVLFLWLIGRVADILLLVFIAALLALYLNSLTQFLINRVRVPHRFAFILALFITLGGIYGMFALLVPPVVEQTRQLVSVLPDYIRGWQAALGRLVARYPALRESIPQPDEAVGAIIQQAEGAVGGLVPKVFSLGHLLVNLVSILVMGIYMSLYPGMYREWLIALFPPIHRDLLRDVLADLGTTLKTWIVAQLLAMSILAMLTAIGLYALGVPYWLTFGLFTGAVVIVPFFGTLLGTVLPALFVLGGNGFAGFGPGGHFLMVILLGVLIHIIEGNVVMPLITAKRLEIPPVLAMMSVLIVGRLLGLGGVIVAVPLLATTMVIVRRVLINRIYEGQNFRRSSRDRVLVLRVPAPESGVLVNAGPHVDVLRRPGGGMDVRVTEATDRPA